GARTPRGAHVPLRTEESGRSAASAIRSAACAMMWDAGHLHLRPRQDPREVLPVKVVLRCVADHAHAHHLLSEVAAREAVAGELLDGALGVHADHRATASRASPLSARARSCSASTCSTAARRRYDRLRRSLRATASSRSSCSRPTTMLVTMYRRRPRCRPTPIVVVNLH